MALVGVWSEEKMNWGFHIYSKIGSGESVTNSVRGARERV